MCWVLKFRLIMYVQKLTSLLSKYLPSLIKKSFKSGKYLNNPSWWKCRQWPLRNFYTSNYLVDSYGNTISGWAVGLTYGNFSIKLAHVKKPCIPCAYGFWDASFFFLWASFWRWRNFHTITRPIWKSYILDNLPNWKSDRNENIFWD